MRSATSKTTSSERTMRYQDLPVEERMQKASEYALLSIDTDLPQEEVIKEMQQTFYLNEAQAAAAFAQMRKNYRSEYRGAVNRSITRGVILLITSVLIGVFYYFIGQEFGFFLFFAILCFLGGLGALLQIGKKISERFFHSSNPGNNPFVYKDKDGKEQLHWTTSLLFLSFFLMLVTGFIYFSKSGYLDLNKVATAKGLLIREEVTKGKEGGKNPDYYYEFVFAGVVHTVRFFDDYYEYAEHHMHKDLFKKGDWVDITISKEDEARFYSDYERLEVKMYNIYRDGVPLVDLEYRNEQVLKKNEKTFYIMCAVFTASLTLMVLWHRLTQQ